jgi:hypothetical protein
MGLRTKIDWRYAGLHVNDVQLFDPIEDRDLTNPGVNRSNMQAISMPDGNQYLLSYGYFIPFYPPPDEEDVLSKRYESITDLANRFDHNAHTDRMDDFTYEDIEGYNEIKDYEHLTKYENIKNKEEKKSFKSRYEVSHEESSKQTNGAAYVHAAIGLIGRIAQALLHERTLRNEVGISVIPLAEKLSEAAKGYNKKTDPEKAELRDLLRTQMSSLYKELLMNPNLISHMRKTRPIRHLQEAIKDYSPHHFSAEAAEKFIALSQTSPRFDIIGSLHEMIQEVGKDSNIAKRSQDIDTKQLIGTFTEAQHNRVLKIGAAMRCIDEICERLSAVCKTDVAFQRVPVDSTLDEMRDYAKAMICVKGRDINNYAVVNQAFVSVMKSLNAQSKALKGKNAHTDEALKVIEFGFDLIADMANTRLPCNEVFWGIAAKPDHCIVGFPEKEDAYNEFEKNRHEKNKEFGITVRKADPRSSLTFFEDVVSTYLAKARHNIISPGNAVTKVIDPIRLSAGISAGLIM